MMEDEQDVDAEEEEEEEEDYERPTLSKKQMESNISHQMEEMKSARALQVERKLRYLLQQSDIFKHFGVDASKIDTEKTLAKKQDKRRMNEKEGDSELLRGEADGGTKGVRLLKQPSTIVGEMRTYQLEVCFCF
jgi:hypothetical protein